jgi:hypothetical protein
MITFYNMRSGDWYFKFNGSWRYIRNFEVNFCNLSLTSIEEQRIIKHSVSQITMDSIDEFITMLKLLT